MNFYIVRNYLRGFQLLNFCRKLSITASGLSGKIVSALPAQLYVLVQCLRCRSHKPSGNGRMRSRARHCVHMLRELSLWQPCYDTGVTLWNPWPWGQLQTMSRVSNNSLWELHSGRDRESESERAFFTFSLTRGITCSYLHTFPT